MKKLIVLAAALACAAATGCGGKHKSGPTTAGAGSASGSAMGSGDMGGMAMGSDAGSAVETKPAPPPPPPPPAKTPEEMAARYQECWGLWNDSKYDDFKSCYTADATSETPGSSMPAASGADAIVDGSKQFKSGIPDLKGALQLVLQNGNHTVGIALLTGTNSEAMKTPMGDLKASKKKVGLLFAHAVEFNDQAVVSKEWAFYDTATLLAQIGASKMPARKAMTKGAAAPEVVIAKNDDKEKANLATAQAMVDAFNKHDAKAFGALVSDKMVWSEEAMAKDENKKQLLAGTGMMWKAFSDLHFTVKDAWAAGDYVVVVASFDGTNDGDLPMMKLKKTGKTIASPFLAVHKFDGGKNTATWIFFQGMDMAAQLGVMPGAPHAKK